MEQIRTRSIDRLYFFFINTDTESVFQKNNQQCSFETAYFISRHVIVFKTFAKQKNTAVYQVVSDRTKETLLRRGFRKIKVTALV